MFKFHLKLPQIITAAPAELHKETLSNLLMTTACRMINQYKVTNTPITPSVVMLADKTAEAHCKRYSEFVQRLNRESGIENPQHRVRVKGTIVFTFNPITDMLVIDTSGITYRRFKSKPDRKSYTAKIKKCFAVLKSACKPAIPSPDIW